MGLCKCPKRKVTNLFCFVHRVNVCEDCMLSDHPTCTVHSYLQWLEDSDYDDVCVLCSHSIQQGPVLRLSCYDLFHVECLHSYMTTQHADKCPKCKELIVPPRHFVSPVADQLRLSIGTFQPPPTATSHRSGVTSHSTEATSHKARAEATSHRPGATSHSTEATSHKARAETTSQSMASDDKYHTKVWSSGPRQWLKGEQSNKVLEGGMYRLIFAVGLTVILAVTLIIVMTRVGRQVAKSDTSLDWNFNPQLRTGN